MSRNLENFFYFLSKHEYLFIIKQILVVKLTKKGLIEFWKTSSCEFCHIISLVSYNAVAFYNKRPYNSGVFYKPDFVEF